MSESSPWLRSRFAEHRLIKEFYSKEGQRCLRQARIDSAVLDRMKDAALLDIAQKHYDAMIRIDNILFGFPRIWWDSGQDSGSMVWIGRNGIVCIRELQPDEVYAPAF